MILILTFALILLAGLITLPLAKGAGPGRVAAFVVLTILSPVLALVLVDTGVVPTLGDDEETTSQVEEETLAEMEEALEAEIQLPLKNSPAAESLYGDHPTVWQFEQDYTLLCAARDFPDSKVLDCWAPDGAIGADPLGLDEMEDLEDLEDFEEFEDLDELE